MSWVGSLCLIGDGLEDLLTLIKLWTNQPLHIYMNIYPPPSDVKYNLPHRRNFKNINIRTEIYRNSFPYCFSEWEDLSDEIKSLPKLSQFKNRLLESIREPKRSSFGINDIPDIMLLTKLRVEFSDLRSHMFSHNFILHHFH